MFLDAASYAQITGLINGIESLNGSNYVSWKEKLEITLALLDLDYALNNNAPKEPEEDSENYEALLKVYNDEKALWEPSNRKCYMVIKSSTIESIRGWTHKVLRNTLAKLRISSKVPQKFMQAL